MMNKLLALGLLVFIFCLITAKLIINADKQHSKRVQKTSRNKPKPPSSNQQGGRIS